MEDQKYYEKYLKYKSKYLGLQKLIGGEAYKKFIVCTHPQRLQCILASLFSEKYLSSEEKKLKFYDGTIIKIYEEKNVEGQSVENKSICKNENKHFKFMMINPSDPSDKIKYKEFWVNESFNYKYNTLCIPLVINGENMFIYDQTKSNENIVIYLVCSNSISDSQSEPCKKICTLINSDLILKGGDRISNYYLGCSNFNKSIALINAIKNVMSTEIKQASQNEEDVPLPIVIPCLNEVFYKEDGNCDGILATTATNVAKKLTTDIYSDECKDGSDNHKLVNWDIIIKFKEKKIACSLIHIIPFIYYIGSNNCEIGKINTRLDDSQFFKQTNIRKGIEALKSFGKSIKGLFSNKPAEVQTVKK